MKDLSGKRFGKLLAVSMLRKRTNSGVSRIYWKCECECGSRSTVISTALLTGNTKSCGCAHAEALKGNRFNFKHGSARCGKLTPIYKRWAAMIERCRSPKHKCFKRYGGRGIKVCKQWMSFSNFKTWAAGSGFRNHLQIDRRNNNLGYNPRNCRWVTPLVNQSNRSSNFFLNIDGEKMTLAAASRRFGIPYNTIRNRILYGGRTHKQAVAA